MVWRVVVHAVALASLSSMAGATLFNIQDNAPARPGLTSDGLPLHWWDGGPAFTLASAGAVRVNFRGVIAYPANAILRDLEKGVSGWHGVKCNVSAFAQCSSDVGQVLPWAEPRVPDRTSTAIAVDGWNDLACAASGGKILTSKGVYDVSACDILDEGLDVLYSRGMVYHRHNLIPVWKYWTLVVLSIVLVRFLSYNVRVLWDIRTAEEEGGLKEQWVPLVCSLTLLVLVLLDGDSAFVTSADQLFFWSTAGYILIYLVLHGWSRRRALLWRVPAGEQVPEQGGEEASQYEQPVYNVIVATLQLVAMRFYSAAETPYNMVLLGMLACRAWTKILDRQARPAGSHGAPWTLVLDSLYLSLSIELGFDGTYELLVGILGVAYVAGGLLAR